MSSRSGAQYSASQIARWFIAWSDECEAPIDSLKLQKLLYYSQGHYLAKHGGPLFRDEIKAWAHGPVVPAVWHEYKQFGNQDIDPDILGSDFDWDDYKRVDAFLVELYNTYGKYAGWTLRNMTHREMPWKKNFDGADNSKLIPLDDLRDFFETVA